MAKAIVMRRRISYSGGSERESASSQWWLVVRN